MTTGYASDSNGSSGKRVRFNNTNDIPILTCDEEYMAPLKAAIEYIENRSATLHYALRTSVESYAQSFLRSFATYHQAKRKYDREVNDVSFIPPGGRFIFTLQPKKRVEQLPEFKKVAQEAESIVKQYRQLLKEQSMKVTALNVQALKDEMVENFATCLPRIAELLYAQENVENESAHTAVANLLHGRSDEVLSHLNIDSKTFKETYIKVHGINSFPQTSNPPPEQQPINEAVHMRGGGGNDGNTGINNSNSGQQQGPPFAAQPPMPRNPYLNNNPIPVSQVTTPNNNSTALVVRNPTSVQVAAASPALNPQQLVLNSQSDTTLLTQEGQGADNNSTAEAMDCEQEDDEEEGQERDTSTSTSNNGTGGGGGGQPPGGPPTAPTAPRGNPKMLSIHRLLTSIVKEVLVAPVASYQRQVAANDTTSRIKSVAKRQNLTSTTDKVAEAISKAGTVDPKIIKVMIKEEVKSALDERDAGDGKKKGKGNKNNKKNNNNKPPSKEKGGPTVKGAPDVKKSPPKQNTGGSEEGKSGGTATGSRTKGTPSSKKSTKGNGKSGRTKKNKNSRDSRKE